MPHIVIYNLVSTTDFLDDRVEQIEKAVTQGILGITELGLSEEAISYSFPYDPTVVSDEIPVIIIVELLFEKPQRTYEVRQRMAKRIGEAFRLTVNTWRRLTKVEVAVKRFNPEEDGFYSWAG